MASFDDLGASAHLPLRYPGEGLPDLVRRRLVFRYVGLEGRLFTHVGVRVTRSVSSRSFLADFR